MGSPSPKAAVLIGVAGSGKTAIGTRLAKQLHFLFLDADDFHPPANVEKMGSR
jgi:gluconokinase